MHITKLNLGSDDFVESRGEKYYLTFNAMKCELRWYDANLQLNLGKHWGEKREN